MSHSTISLYRLKDDAEAMDDAGYFVASLAQLIRDVHDIGDATDREEIINGHTMGGLMVGLRLIGNDLICRADALKCLIHNAEHPATNKG